MTVRLLDEVGDVGGLLHGDAGPAHHSGELLRGHGVKGAVDLPGQSARQGQPITSCTVCTSLARSMAMSKERTASRTFGAMARGAGEERQGRAKVEGGNFVPERAAAHSSFCRVLLHALVRYTTKN